MIDVFFALLSLNAVSTIDAETLLFFELGGRYGYEIVAVEEVRLKAEGRYTLGNLRVRVENRFPLL